MPFMKLVTVAALFMLAAACDGSSIRQGVCQGVYEGFRTEDQLHNTPRERADKPDLNYEQYSRERKARIEQDTQ